MGGATAVWGMTPDRMPESSQPGSGQDAQPPGHAWWMFQGKSDREPEHMLRPRPMNPPMGVFG